MVEMREKITIWNKTGDALLAKVRLIIDYEHLHLFDEHAEEFVAWKAEETGREIVIELFKDDGEEDE